MNHIGGTAALSGEFRRECEQTYFKLYYIYDVLNQLCLLGELERVLLRLNFDRNEERVLASANLFRIPWRRKPFCFIEIKLFPCAELSTGCFLGVMLHEMSHIWDFQHGRAANHDKAFYDRMLRIGFDDKSMTFQENSLFARAIDLIFRQRLRLKDGLNMLCSYPGTKPEWDETEFYRSYLDRTLQLRRRQTAAGRIVAAS